MDSEKLGKESKLIGKGYRQMRHVTRHAMVTCLILAFLIGQWGCATRRYTPPSPLSEQVRADLGTIGVVSARFAPETQLEAPTSGKGSGAAKGAVKGFLGSIGVGLDNVHSSDSSGLVLGIVLAPVFALGGAVYGTIAAESGQKVQEAQSTLNKAVADLNIPEAMRDRVFQIAQQETRYPLVLLTEQAPSGREAVFADTILEVSVPRFGLEGGGINPPLPLVVTAHARLVGVADGTEIYAAQWTYRSGTLKFVDWAANNAQPLRTDLERAVQTLAETIVEELFLLYRIPDVENKSP